MIEPAKRALSRLFLERNQPLRFHLRCASNLSKAFQNVKQVRQLDEASIDAVRAWLRELQNARLSEVVNPSVSSEQGSDIWHQLILFLKECLDISASRSSGPGGQVRHPSSRSRRCKLRRVL